MTNFYINNDGSGRDTILPEQYTIRSGAIIYRNVELGENIHIGHNALIRENCKLGEDVSIGSGCILEHSVTVEDRCRIHSACFIPEFTILKSDCWIGPRVTITNSRYPNTKSSKLELEPVTISSLVIVGANVTILPGVTIGENALIGAGAVITKSVPPGSVVFGNPALVRGKR